MFNDAPFGQTALFRIAVVANSVAVILFVFSSVLPAGASEAWGVAIEVPGLSVLNTGHSAVVDAIDCSSAGNCSAGGYYWIRPPGTQAFVENEVNGKWQGAIEVPGISTIETGANGSSSINALSCASSGNCSAGGTYDYGSVQGQAFVVDEVNGVWGDALEVPGTAALNTYIYGSATVNAISCPSVGNCSAGGSFGFAQYGNEAFVVDQVDGVWGTAIVPPSSTEIGGYGLAPVNTISCSSAGNCSVSGTFYNPKRHTSGSNFSQIYVDSEVNGVWGDAIELPGSTVVNRGGTATVNSISCSSAGNCSVVGGLETDSGMNPKISGTFQAFVANEVNGVWNTVTEPPGSVTVNNGESAEFNSVSCTSDGNCSAGGYLQVSSTKRQAFVASENNGVWSHVIEIPGSAALNGGGDAMVNVISCASNKNCVAGGYYYANPKQREAFLADEVNGKWNRAFEVPGTASLNTSWAEVDAVSCSSTNFCSAGGKYSTRAGGYQAFVVSN